MCVLEEGLEEGYVLREEGEYVHNRSEDMEKEIKIDAKERQKHEHIRQEDLRLEYVSLPTPPAQQC